MPHKFIDYIDAMDERELSLAVVGIDRPNEDRAKSDRRFNMLLCAPGDPVELRPDPKDQHDTNAIAVFDERGTQLGYLTAERAPWIGAKIRAGEEWHAIFQQPGSLTAVIRVRFGGGVPTLPVPRPPRKPLDGEEEENDLFYPDAEGPEWGA